MPVIYINNDDIRLNSSSSDKVVVNGNLGIGTTIPITKLDVVGDAYIYDSSVTASGLRIDTGTANLVKLRVGYPGDWANADVQIQSSTTSGLDTGIYLKAGGNVGIGTTNPSAKFHVAGNKTILSDYGNTGHQIYTYEVSTGTSTSSNQVFDMYLGRFGNGYHKVTIWGSGYGTDVGNYFDITTSWGATSAPKIITNGGLTLGGGATYTLHYVRVDYASYDVFMKYSSSMPSGYSNTLTYIIESNTGSGYTQFSYPSGVTIPTLSSSNQIYSTATFNYYSGNVGIGTTSPGYKLEVVGGSINNQIARFVTADFPSHSIGLGVDAQSTNWAASIFQDDVKRFTIESNGGILVGSNYQGSDAPANGAAIEGNVGIGTTNPTGKLQVNTSSGGANALQLGVSNQEQFVFETGISGITNAALVIKDSTTPYTYLTLRSGNVGINTTNPGARLDVVGYVRVEYANSSTTLSSGGSILRLANSDTTADNISAIDFPQSSAGSGFSRIGVIYKDRTASSEDQDMFFRTIGGGSSAEVMRLTSTGNVGIGTDNPTGKLHIAQSNSGGVAAILLSEDESTIQGPEANTQIRMGGNLVLGGSNIMTFGTNGSERMRVTSDGSLLVGATSQTYNNATYGYIASFKGAVTSQAYISVALSNQASTSEGMLFGLNSASGDIYVLDNKPLVLYTNATEKMRIAAGGNVLIGTTSDSGYKLDVNGTGRFSNSLLVTTSAAGSLTAKIRNTVTSASGNTGYGLAIESEASGATSYALTVRNLAESTTYFHISTATGSVGNVGIGTTSPSEKLEVTGNVIRVNSDAGGFYQYTSAGVFRSAFYDNGTVTQIYADGNGSTPVMTFNSGNVGIGTTNPFEKLHVNGRIYVTSNPGSDGIVLAGSGSTNNPYAYITSTNEGTQDVGMAFYVTTDAGTTNTEAIRIDDQGNVGIGTTSPNTWKLSVDSSTIYAASFDTSNNVGVVINGNDTTASQIIGFSNSASTYNALHLRTNSTPTSGLYINTSGNVGIGTTSPDNPLEVFGSNNGIKISSISTDRPHLRFESGTSEHLVLSANSTYGAIGDSTNVNRYMIFNAGNVGIGTTSPDSKFHVEDTNPEVRITGTGGTSFPRLLWEYPVSATQASRWALTGGASANVFYLYNYTQSKKVLQVDGTASHITLNHDAAGTTQIGTSTTQTAYQLYVATNVGQTGAIEAAGSVKITSGALGVNIAASATAGRIDASNDIVAYSTSDKRLKENIKPLENATEKVKKLTGVEFDWKEEHKAVHGYEGHDVGVIAQEVQEVLPEAIRTNDSGYLSVRYEKMIALLIESNKELAARVEELEQKLKQ